MADESGSSISVGEVISNSFGVIQRNPAVILGSTLVFGALPSVAVSYVSSHVMAMQKPFVPGHMPSFSGSIIIMELAVFVLMALNHIIIVRATDDDRHGQPVTLGRCLAGALGLILPLLGLYILGYLGFLLGLVLLVVPGVIVGLMWAVAGPALIVERCGVFAAFGRSRALTKGNRWRILGLLILLLVIFWMFMMVVGLLTIGTASVLAFSIRQMSGQLPYSYYVLMLVISTLTSAFTATVFANLYFALRTAKEGPRTEHLAEIFA